MVMIFIKQLEERAMEDEGIEKCREEHPPQLNSRFTETGVLPPLLSTSQLYLPLLA